jgi:enoyl-[acyl-carrier protein] reductase II
MAGITDATLASAVSEAGGLGTIAAATETGESLKEQISRLRSISEAPFAVNVPLVIPQAQELLSVVIEQRAPVLILAAGNTGSILPDLKKAGITIIQVVPTVEAAARAESAGVDAVIAEGFESGGIGSPYEIGALSLIPQVVNRVKIPVIAAGGIADPRGFAACLMLGAEGISVGTAFLAAKECTRIGNAWRNHLLRGTDTSTKIVGRGVLPVRLLKNSTSDDIEKRISQGAGRTEILEHVFAATLAGDEDGAFPCGQGVGLIDNIRSAKEIIDDFVLGAKDVVSRVFAGMSSGK